MGAMYLICNSNDFIMKRSFEISEEEGKEIHLWKEAIRTVFGEYGQFEYRFGEGGGIGYTIKVWSSLANIEKDFTDYDSF